MNHPNSDHHVSKGLGAEEVVTLGERFLKWPNRLWDLRLEFETIDPGCPMVRAV